jgi:hypothetical protein
MTGRGNSSRAGRACRRGGCSEAAASVLLTLLGRSAWEVSDAFIDTVGHCCRHFLCVPCACRVRAAEFDPSSHRQSRHCRSRGRPGKVGRPADSAFEAKVVHADTAQLFMFGEPGGRQAHVLIPAPAIDAAHVGDVVEVTGRVRRYSPSDFEKDYSWFKKADYPDVHSGDWVIVASSVRTPEGTQLVPGSTVSDLPPNAPKTRPPSK